MKLKQLKTMGKVIATSALALIMCFGAVTPAFAAQSPNSEEAIVTDDETSIVAAITKVFETGETTDIPNTTFTFEFAQITDATSMPDAKGNTIDIVTDAEPIGDITAELKDTMIGTEDTVARKKTVEVETANFLDGLSYDKAGIYVYKVTEQADTYTITDGTKESLDYSDAEYTMYVYVANKEDGTGTYIKALGTVYSKDQTGKGVGETGAEPEVGSKVDPTPNETTVTTGEIDTDNSEMKFVNKYLKTDGGGGDPETPANQTLELEKKVDGDLADQTKYFEFAVTLKAPEVATNTVYKGYVVDKDNNVVTAEANGGTQITDGGKTYIEFSLTDGVGSQTVKLKHEQRLVFSDASVGTHFQAIETGVKDYTPVAIVKVNNASTTLTGTTGNNLDTTERIVGENKANGAFFTNTLTDVTPTGIILNNIPFVLLILVGAAAIAVSVIIKGRKNNHTAIH